MTDVAVAVLGVVILMSRHGSGMGMKRAGADVCKGGEYRHGDEK